MKRKYDINYGKGYSKFTEDDRLRPVFIKFSEINGNKAKKTVMCWEDYKMIDFMKITIRKYDQETLKQS